MQMIILNSKIALKKMFRSKSKGEVNYFLAIMVGAALLLVIVWPAVSKIVETLFTTIATWFSTNISKIFKAIS